jgi:hypothetical protein
MPCCGQKRALQQPTPTPAARPHVQAPIAIGATAQFEYVGNRVLTVVGQGTGRQYRFVGNGAKLIVDGRDRTSLARVPGLREMPARL